jgi:hypothetical protein
MKTRCGFSQFFVIAFAEAVGFQSLAKVFAKIAGGVTATHDSIGHSLLLSVELD